MTLAEKQKVTAENKAKLKAEADASYQELLKKIGKRFYSIFANLDAGTVEISEYEIDSIRYSELGWHETFYKNLKDDSILSIPSINSDTNDIQFVERQSYEFHQIPNHFKVTCVQSELKLVLDEIAKRARVFYDKQEELLSKQVDDLLMLSTIFRNSISSSATTYLSSND